MTLRRTRYPSLMLQLGMVLALVAQSATTYANAQAGTNVGAPQASTARSTPDNSANCGMQGSRSLWSFGGVFVDTSKLNTRSRQEVAVVWCAYLATGGIPAEFATLGRWSDAQLADDLPLDLGIEWARATAATGRDSRIRFHIDQLDEGAIEHFKITTVIEHVDSAKFETRATHIVLANVQKDTVRFESAFVSKLASSMRWISSPIEFVRLDTGMVDTVRAKAGSAFVADTRRRLGIASPTGEQVLYLYSRAGNGRDLLGFSEFAASIDGFSASIPRKFVFANVPVAGEFYRHELVHAALMAYAKPMSQALGESLARALGGTLHRTWPEFVCDERSLVLTPAHVPDLPTLFAQPDSMQNNAWIFGWELAFYIDFMIAQSGDQALRALLSGPYYLDRRDTARAGIAKLLGMSEATFLEQLSARYSEKELAKRCKQ